MVNRNGELDTTDIIRAIKITIQLDCKTKRTHESNSNINSKRTRTLNHNNRKINESGSNNRGM